MSQQQNIQTNTTVVAQEQGVDLMRLMRRISRYWYIFLLFSMLAGFSAWLYLRYQVPIYEVKSTILIKDDKNKQGISASDLISKEFGLGDTRKRLVDESQIMTSYSVMEEVVRELKIDRTVSVVGSINISEIYGANMPIVIDSFSLKDIIKGFKAKMHVLDQSRFEITLDNLKKQEAYFGRPFTNEYGTFWVSHNPSLFEDAYANKVFLLHCKGMGKAIRDLTKDINIVLPKKESNMLEPNMRTKMPEKAKDILRQIVRVYNEHNVNDKNEVSQNTLRFIEKRLLSLTAELSGVEQNVEQYKTREGITADAASDIGYLFNRLGQYDSELVKLEVQNQVLNSIQALLSKDEVSFELLPTSLELKSLALQNQINDYNKAVLERNRLMKVAGENNPNLKNLTEDLNRTRVAIIESIRRVTQDNNNLLQQTKSKNTQFATKLGSTPRKERELTEIKRQQNIKEGLYLFLLQKQEETAISMVGAIADAQVINPPIASDFPVSASKKMIYLWALLIGILLSLGYVLLRGWLVNVIESEEDITTQTTMPILAKIPYGRSGENLVIKQSSRSAIAEMFRLMRTNLQFFLPEQVQQDASTGRVIMVTSTISGEGKSFITLNLGMSLALTNKRIVIVGLDLRRPKLSDYMGVSRGMVGVTNYLISDIDPATMIQKSGEHDNLFFIPSGPIPPNPSELMMNPKMKQLFDYLRANFDYIVVDTSPVGLVTDAFLLNPLIDMTLFVVRFAYSKKTQIELIDMLNREEKLKSPAIVLNGVKWDDKGSYGYGYGYGYGYYNEDETKHKSSWWKKLFGGSKKGGKNGVKNVKGK